MVLRHGWLVIEQIDVRRSPGLMEVDDTFRAGRMVQTTAGRSLGRAAHEGTKGSGAKKGSGSAQEDAPVGGI
jgi:hypothetical protein